MYFRISSVIHDQRQIQISDDDHTGNDNTFTIITGRNASGKSRLLRKIVSNYIFSDRYDILEASDVLPSFYSETRPSCVIAVSTGAKDRFPRPNNKLSESGIDYHYIGSFYASGGVNRAISTLSSSFLQVIRNLSDDDRSSAALAMAFEMLGYKSSFNLKFSESFEIRDEMRSRKKQHIINIDMDLPVNQLTSLYNILNIRPGDHFTLNLDILTGSRSQRVLDILPLIVGLVEAGHLRVIDTELYSLKDKERHKISDASSGQQCMIQMLIGVAASIRSGALICIDEPEVSLHPEWQTKVISLLQEIFSSYSGCHFIIATHSPQVVAGLHSENSRVINLENHQVFISGTYSARSADFQLSRIFEEPGFRNEFLLRSSLRILNRLAKGQLLEASDTQTIKHLEKIKTRLQANDPVLHLINQIGALNTK